VAWLVITTASTRNGYVATVSASYMAQPASFGRIYLGGVPRGTTELELRAALALVGVKVGGIEFVLDRVTGLQRGFAFVVLSVPLDTRSDPLVLERLRRTPLEGRVLDVQGIPDRLPR